MILKRLRSETQAQHSALESRIPLMDPALSLLEYRLLLTRFYGYYVPLEARLVAWSEAEARGINYVERMKVPELERDLIALGETAETIARLPRCAALPALATEAEALGCLYVVEGATLGGQLITKQLQKNFAMTRETGGAFFAGYGAETGLRWQEFGAMITAQALRLERDDVIVASANRTFETLGHWLFR